MRSSSTDPRKHLALPLSHFGPPATVESQPLAAPGQTVLHRSRSPPESPSGKPSTLHKSRFRLPGSTRASPLFPSPTKTGYFPEPFLISPGRTKAPTPICPIPGRIFYLDDPDTIVDHPGACGQIRIRSLYEFSSHREKSLPRDLNGDENKPAK